MTTYIYDLSGSPLEDDYFDSLDEDLIDQMQKRGRIFSCTPLKNFKFRRSEIKKFSNWLSEKVTDNFSCAYKAVVSSFNNTSNNPFLKVCVEKLQNNRALGAVYEGTFFKWRANENDEQINEPDLPYLYCSGNQKFLNLINSLLQKYLGCSINAVMFSQFECRWLVVLTLQHIVKTEQTIQFVFENPHIQSKFCFDLSFGVLKCMWNYILNEENNEISYAEVATLHETLVEHVINTYGFDLNRFQLKVFSIPGFITIDVSGKIHVRRNELLDLLYRFLNDQKSENF